MQPSRVGPHVRMDGSRQRPSFHVSTTRTRLTVVAVIATLALGVALWVGYRDGLPEILPDGAQRFLTHNRIPDHIVTANGRLEATDIDVAAKLPGRIAAVLVREGDMVEPLQVVARLDIASLEAQLRQAQAELQRARKDQEYARAVRTQRVSEFDYADKELARLLQLEKSGHVSTEQVDKARMQSRTAEAALRAASVKVAETEAAIAAAAAQIDRIDADIEDSVLRAPRRGRVLYRLAEPGEVLGAGGKVLTLLDLSDVYMVLFLPETMAGRVTIGNQVRIVLDAAPEYVIPAAVSFVAVRAQFTPKQVETRSEREKLVFRVKARVDPELLRRYEPLVKTGLPGVAYVNLERQGDWPEWLEPQLPPWPEPVATSPN